MSTTLEDLEKAAEIAGDSIPAVLMLAAAITKIVNAKEDAAAQLDALQTAAEGVKYQMDQIKFREESRLANIPFEPGT